MKQTPNLSLKKPELTDVVNIEDLNQNFDTIDTEIKSAKEKADQAFQSASDGKSKIATAITGKGIPTSSSDTFQKMATNISAIETDKTGDATAVAEDILAGKSAYVKGARVTGTKTNYENMETPYSPATSQITDVKSGLWENVTGKGTKLKFKLSFKGAVNENTIIHQSIYGLHPSIIKKGELIGANHTDSGTNRLVGEYVGLDGINGTKGTYYAYAGNNIKTGDFIKFQTGVSGVGAGTAQWRDLLAGRIVMDVTTISPTQILVLNCYDTYVTYATLINVDGVEFSIGADVIVGQNSAASYQHTKIINYGNGYISILKSVSDTTVYAGLIKVSGATISVISDTEKNYTNLSSISSSISIFTTSVDLAYRGSASPLCKAITGTNYFSLVGYENGSSSSGNRMHMLFSVNYLTGAITFHSGIWTYGISSGRCSMQYSKDGNVLLSVSYDYTSGSYAHKLAISTSGIVQEAVGSGLQMGTGSNLKSCCYYSDTQGILVTDASNSVTSVYAFTQGGAKITSGEAVVVESTDGNAPGAWTIRLDTNVVVLMHTKRNSNGLGLRTITLNGNTISLGGSNNLTGSSYSKFQGGLRLAQNLVGGKFLVFSSMNFWNALDSKVMVLNAPTNSTIDTINYLYETQIAKANNRNEINGVALGDAIGGTSTGAGAAHNQATHAVTI